jgi:peptidoglycan/LPS O-acetylase OafA/YrhL
LPPARSQTSPQAASVAPTRGRRLAWLDALRGIAALFVVFDHLSYHVLQSVRGAVYHVFDPGLYGVFVFFMVSGYIIPASLERKGSIRSFWLSRLFRLFPLFGFAIVAVFVMHGFGYASLRDANTHPTAAVFAHLFMLSDVLGVSNVINVLWTLSYEMVFYLLLTALFAVGVHQRSERFAVGFAAAALLLGGLLPTVWLSHSSLGVTSVAVAADLLIIGGLALAVVGHRLPRTLGAWLAAATGLTLVAFNERVYAYEGLTILALMFTGTMLYRAEHGQIARRKAATLAIVVFAAAIAAGAWHIASIYPHDPGLRQRQWILSVALAGLTFAIGMALRKLPVPSVLAWLGLVSYSIYLLHPLLIDVYTEVPWTHGSHPFGVQVVLAAGFLAALLAVCAVTYYLVEAPMQRLGHRVAARLDARFGPDRLATTGVPAS